MARTSADTRYLKLVADRDQPNLFPETALLAVAPTVASKDRLEADDAAYRLIVRGRLGGGTFRRLSPEEIRRRYPATEG